MTQNGTNVPIGAGQTSTVVTLNSVGTVNFILTATGALGAAATAQASVQVTPASSPGDISAVNHITFLAQENRSFDTYFGKLNEYRAQFGLPPDVDGLPDNCSSTNSDWTKPCRPASPREFRLVRATTAYRDWIKEPLPAGARFLNLKSENLSLRIPSGKQIDDVLDGVVCFLISDLQFAGRGSPAGCY